MLTGKSRLLPPLVLLVLSAALLAGLWFTQRDTAETFWGQAPPAVRAILWPEMKPVEPFELRTQDGEPFGPEQLKGQWNFIFFGFLQCPDVCPTSLQAIREMRSAMVSRNPDAAQHQFIFVTVDPEHDSPEQLGEYLAFYEPAMVGLHGPQEQLRRLAKPMSVRFFERVDEDGRRSIDHTSSLMVVDPRGRIVAALPPPLQPERMLAQFTRLRDYLGPMSERF